MIKKIYAFAIYELIRIRDFILLLSDFNINDSFKLRYFTFDVSCKKFLYLKPRKWLHNIKIRNDYRDKRTFRDIILPKYHLPPKGVVLTKDSIVVDLGSNIGLTIAHMKNIYPDIKVIGYEMDIDNFLLAKRNTQTYDKVHLYNKAIWVNKTIVEYHKDSSFDGYSINVGPNDDRNTKIKGITLKDVIDEHQIKKIDYMKMDIEGVEKNILTHHDLSWLHYIKSMNIEMHLKEGENIETYIKIIKDQGFYAWKDTKHRSSIMAVKNL